MTLISAQVGAQAHAYSHLQRGADPSGMAGGAPNQVCGECLSFAPLLAAASVTDFALLVPLLESSFAPQIVQVARGDRFHLHAFRARAPPSLI